MRSIYSLLLRIAATGLLFSCNKDIKVEEPDFEVEVASATARAGDSVIFTITGNPDIISFYSGELGNSYEYIDKDRVLPTESVNMSFQSQVRSQSGTSATYCQDHQFHVLVSTDLNLAGATMADSALSVQNATWKEITDSFVICPLECSSATPYYNSGIKDIKNLFVPGKPLRVAFKYINLPNPTNGRANIWRFSSFQMTASNALGSGTLTSQADAGWTPVYIGTGWNLSTAFGATSTVVTLRGLTTNLVNQEMWCISKPIELTDANLGREYAIGIKAYADPPLKSYGHRFSKPGIYTVTFVATNTNVYDKKPVVRQIQMTIQP